MVAILARVIGPRASTAVLATSLALAGCGILAPTPTPEPPPTFASQLLVDLGLFGGFPDIPPAFAMAELEDGTTVLVVDRGAVQQVRRIELDDGRWASLGGFDRPILADGPGPLLANVAVGPDDGFPDGATLLIARIPNGPINQLELEVDGERQTLWIHDKPLMVVAYPAGTELGHEATTLDAGTSRLGVEPISGPD